MSKELTYLQKLEKDYLRIEAENETLSSANQNLLHEVRVLKNKAENLEHDFMCYFKLANKLDHQIRQYQKALEFYAMSGQAIGETKHGEVRSEEQKSELMSRS